MKISWSGLLEVLLTVYDQTLLIIYLLPYEQIYHWFIAPSLTRNGTLCPAFSAMMN